MDSDESPKPADAESAEPTKALDETDEHGPADSAASGDGASPKASEGAHPGGDSPGGVETTEDESAAEESSEKAQAPNAEKRPARRARAEAKRPPTEAEINSPDIRSMLLFGVIFMVTAVSWGAARLSCNYHPPQSRPPPELGVDKLAKNPKDAAIEFVFRRRTRNYERAYQLAKGGLALEIEKEGVKCDEQGAACINERSRLEKTVLTTAVVSTIDGDKASALVTNHVGKDKERFALEPERDGAIWKAISQRKL